MNLLRNFVLGESVPYTIQGIKQECSGYTLGVGLTGWGVNGALGVGVTPWLLSRTPVNESRGVIITPHFLQCSCSAMHAM